MTKTVDLKIDNKDINLGTIKVVTNDRILEDINIVAQDVVHKADRDIVVLSEKYKKQAPNAEQVLQRLPSVSMDIVSRSFKVANRNNVLLQVDGITKNEQYIRSLSPSKIIKVEIIRNISGRYANEYDAILNVITDKSLTGYNVSAEDFTIATFDDKNNDILKNTSSISYSNFSSKVNIYGGYVNNYNKYNVVEDKVYSFDDYYVSQSTDAKNNLYSSSVNDVYLGTDFIIAPDKILSAEIRYSYSPFKNNKQERESEFSIYNSNELMSEYLQSSLTKAKNTNPYALLSYEGKVGDKNKINAGISYYYNKNEYSNVIDIEEDITTEIYDSKKNYVDFYIEDKIILSNSFDVDLCYNYRHQEIETSYDIDNTQYDNQNTQNRHNAGFYLNYLINDNSSLKIGSSVENVSLQYESDSYDNSDNQFVVLPFLAYKVQLGKDLSVSLNYKVNTYNPSMSELSPYTSVIDSFSTITGNSLLKPSYYHELKVKASKGFEGCNISLQPFYKFGNDVQSKTGTLVGDHIISYTYENELEYKKYGLDIMGSYFKGLKNKDQIYLSFSAQKFWERASYGEMEHDLDDWKISSQLAYISNKYNSIFAAVFQKDNVKNITAQGYDHNTNDFLAISFKKSFFNRKLDLGCTYITPFDSFVTSHIGSVVLDDSFYYSDTKDVSVVQNSFIFQLVFNLERNGDKQVGKSKKKKIDKDKIKTGLL
jgi:hypothetical protein